MDPAAPSIFLVSPSTARRLGRLSNRHPPARMLRTSILYLSRQQRIFSFIRNVGFARKMASRFVAGETIASALDAVAALNAKGISASLDLLGESVANEAEARETGRQYLEIL